MVNFKIAPYFIALVLGFTLANYSLLATQEPSCFTYRVNQTWKENLKTATHIVAGGACIALACYHHPSQWSIPEIALFTGLMGEGLSQWMSVVSSYTHKHHTTLPPYFKKLQNFLYYISLPLFFYGLGASKHIAFKQKPYQKISEVTGRAFCSAMSIASLCYSIIHSYTASIEQ